MPGTLTITDLRVLRVLQSDLRTLWQIEQLVSGLQWSLQDFQTMLQSPMAGGLVAEVGTDLVGFLLYRVSWPLSRPSDGLVKAAVLPLQTKAADHRYEPLQIVLLNLGVALDRHRRGIAQTLIKRIIQELKLPQDRIQATVPESNLSVQFLLRGAGFKASRVFRGFYGSEDGYLMELLPRQ